MLSTFPIVIVVTLMALAGAAAGVWLTNLPEISRRVIPMGGAVLIVVALGWILPELAANWGWPMAAALLAIAVTATAVIDRLVYPICPTCSHSHDHAACEARLHGFGLPLIVASMLHSLFDGWTIAVGGGALSVAVAVHKVPEGLALGVIFRAAMHNRGNAMFWAAITQMATLPGGLLALAVADSVRTRSVSLVLAAAGGLFLYMGAHAMHGAWKRRGGAEAGVA